MVDTGRALKFHPEWRITLLTLVLLPVLVGLGFWQLQRADEKALLAASWDERQSRSAVSLDQLWDEPAQKLAYLPVALAGEFLRDEYFLLDNRIHSGRFGYEVLGIMRLDGGNRFALVNRGWIAGDPARLSLPTAPSVVGRVELTGHVYVAPGAPYLLAEQQLGNGWPKVLQAVEMAKIAPQFRVFAGGEVFPYPIRIAAGEPGALAVDWQVVNVSPDKHRAYAAQWFTMALVLGIFYLLGNSNLWQLIKPSGSDQD